MLGTVRALPGFTNKIRLLGTVKGPTGLYKKRLLGTVKGPTGLYKKRLLGTFKGLQARPLESGPALLQGLTITLEQNLSDSAITCTRD